MHQSRRTLLKQIECLDKALERQQTQVISQQAKWQEKASSNYWWVLALLIPALCIGWTMSKERWVSKWTIHISELLTFALASYLRRQVLKIIP